MSSYSSPHPREVLLTQYSLYVHKGGLNRIHFISFAQLLSVFWHPSCIIQFLIVTFKKIQYTLALICLAFIQDFQEWLIGFFALGIITRTYFTVHLRKIQPCIIYSKFHFEFISFYRTPYIFSLINS